MATSIATPITTPSASTLADLPKRTFVFLVALGTQVPISDILKVNGFTREDLAEGWTLLAKATGSGTDRRERVVTGAAEAIRELDAWDEVGFHKAHAALRRRFPEQADFTFKDLAPTQGPMAVLGIMKFLDRLDVLEKGEGRSESREVDAQALAVLATRGIGPDERARLRALVALAQSEPNIPEAPEPAKDLESVRLAHLSALYAWYAEWTEVARAVVPRRADRVLLGIAKHPRKKDGADGALPAVSAPVAAPAPQA